MVYILLFALLCLYLFILFSFLYFVVSIFPLFRKAQPFCCSKVELRLCETYMTQSYFFWKIKRNNTWNWKCILKLKFFLVCIYILLIIFMICRSTTRKLFLIPFHEQFMMHSSINTFFMIRWILSFAVFPPVFTKNCFYKKKYCTFKVMFL